MRTLHVQTIRETEKATLYKVFFRLRSTSEMPCNEETEYWTLCWLPKSVVRVVDEATIQVPKSFLKQVVEAIKCSKFALPQRAAMYFPKNIVLDFQ